MKSRLDCSSSRMPFRSAQTGDDPPLTRAFDIATEADLETLRAAQQRYQRQLRWNRGSMIAGLVLGTMAAAAAVFAPLSPGYRLWMATAAILELGIMPVYLTAARRWLRRLIERIAIDLEHGDVANRTGRVRTLLGAGRVIEDLRTGRIRMTPPGFVGLAGLRTGAIVNCRFALRSGVLLNVEPRRRGDRRSSLKTFGAVGGSRCSSEGVDFYDGDFELTRPLAPPTISRDSVFI